MPGHASAYLPTRLENIHKLRQMPMRPCAQIWRKRFWAEVTAWFALKVGCLFAQKLSHLHIKHMCYVWKVHRTLSVILPCTSTNQGYINQTEHCVPGPRTLSRLSAWISWCSHATMRWIWRMQNYAGSPFPRSSWTLNQKQAAMTFLDINWYVSTNDNFNIYKRLTGIPLLMVSRIHHMSMKTLAYT